MFACFFVRARVCVRVFCIHILNNNKKVKGTFGGKKLGEYELCKCLSPQLDCPSVMLLRLCGQVLKIHKLIAT